MPQEKPQHCSACDVPDGLDRRDFLRVSSAAAGLRAMMVLLDGTHADAKRSVVFGEFADARSSAEVLAELGPLLASYRGDAQWKERTAAFVEASRLAARLEGKDPQAYRMALGTIYNRCEACHNRR